MNPDGFIAVISKMVSYGIITASAVLVFVFLLSILNDGGNNDVDLQSPEGSEDFVRTITGSMEVDHLQYGKQ